MAIVSSSMNDCRHNDGIFRIENLINYPIRKSLRVATECLYWDVAAPEVMDSHLTNPTPV